MPLLCIYPAAAAAAKSLQSCPTLCDPMDCSLPSSSVHGIFQARVLEWVAIPSPGDLPNPGIKPMSLASPVLADGFFTAEPPGKPKYRWADAKAQYFFFGCNLFLPWAYL